MFAPSARRRKSLSAAITDRRFGAPLSTSTSPSPVEKASDIRAAPSITAILSVRRLLRENPRRGPQAERARHSALQYDLCRFTLHSLQSCRCCRRTCRVPPPPSAAASGADSRSACAPAAPGAGRPSFILPCAAAHQDVRLRIVVVQVAVAHVRPVHEDRVVEQAFPARPASPPSSSQTPRTSPRARSGS